MVRGRTVGRGARRGGAAAGERQSTDVNDAGAAAPAERASETPGPSVQARGTLNGAVRRGASARASRAAPTTGRFRPKNVRRDEAERESLAREAEEKAREKRMDVRGSAEV